MVIIDVMLIASGFVFRVLAGSAAIRVPPSHWLVLCTILISVFLGFSKRRAELVLLKENATAHRRVLAHYNTTFLDQMISIVTSATLLCYILYTVDVRTVHVFGTRALLLTVPFVMYGIFRYLYLIYHQGDGGDPSRAVFTDTPLLIDLFFWIIACITVVYKGKLFTGWFQ